MPGVFISHRETIVTAMSAWYAIYTRHQHEKNVAHNLARKGFETFLPLYSAPHRWKDRTKVVSLPLFPCYVFLNGDSSRRLDILSTPGIYDIISFANQPAAIPRKEIEDLRRIVESGIPIDPHPFIRSGEAVRVKSGPFAGVEGTLVRKKKLCRLVLSVEILGKSAVVEIESSLVERIKSSRTDGNDVIHASVPAHA
jgi:transcription antitermination factor NusG